MTTLTTYIGATLNVGHSRLAGTFRALCNRCGIAIVLWDDEEELLSHLCDADAFNDADEARQAAIAWQHSFATREMAWSDLADCGEMFGALAVKFPELADEFKENGII